MELTEPAQDKAQLLLRQERARAYHLHDLVNDIAEQLREQEDADVPR